MSSESSESAGGTPPRGGQRPRAEGASTGLKAETTKYVMPPVSIQAVRQMDVLVAVVATCTTRRAAVKISDIVTATGLERRDIHPTLRFLTGTGLLRSSPAGWTPTVPGVGVAQHWNADRTAAGVALAEAWRLSWIYPLLLESVQPGVTLSAESLADAMRPHKTSRITPWMQLVDWLELAQYVQRDDVGSLRLTAHLHDDPAGSAEAADGMSRDREGEPSANPDPSPGLVPPLSMDELLKLNAADFGAVTRSLATIYEVLSRQRA
ncbi:hypothetical protein EES43_11645 [Streptomyces sp. ADI96-02]|nr:hypothetical protein EES43_11645 [Streptomyces sp. ADI96-02]